MRTWCLMLALVGCAPRVEDVQVEVVRPGVAQVRFTSSKPGEGSVVAVDEDGAELVAPAGPEAEEHTITVLGLAPEKRYTFVPRLDDERFDDDAVEGTTPPTGAPPIELVVHDEALACDDRWFLVTLSQLFGASWVLIVDRAGEVVWAEKGPPETFVTRATPGLDGRSLLWNHGDAARVDDVGQVVRLPIDGTTPETTRTLNAHHDFVEHADGTIGWLAYDFREMELEGEQLDVAADVIHEDVEGVQTTDSARTVYNVFDDYPPGVWLLDNGEMDEGHFLPDYSEFSHGNSLVHRPSDDAYFLMFRWLDALVKVDRSTGEQVWQLGGAHSDFTAPDDHAFSHAHMSEIWDGGMLVFDNADGTGRVSGAVEYRIDEAAMTYEKVWEYRDPAGKFEFILGDAHRMKACDNVAISWTTQQRLTEVTRDGEIAWEIRTVPPWLVGRVTPLVDLYDLGAE